jgi:integrase
MQTESLERGISREAAPAWGQSFLEYLQRHTELGPASSKKYMNIIRSMLGRDKAFNIERAATFSRKKNRQYVKAAIVKYLDFMVYSGEISKDARNNFLENIPRVREAPTKPRGLADIESVWKIMDLLEKEYRYVALFLFYTGCRISEAMELRLKDIDFKTRIATVYGKGRMQKKPRSVKLPQEFCDELKKYLLDTGILETEHVFLFDSKASTDSKTVMFNEKFRKACMAVLGRSLGSHEFRRIVGTILIEKTGNLQMVKNVLGHEKLETTLTYTKYADINKSIDQASEIMGAINVRQKEPPEGRVKTRSGAVLSRRVTSTGK